MADAQIGRLSVALVGSTNSFTTEMEKATADAEKFAAGLQRQVTAASLAGRSVEAYELRLRGASDAAVQRVEQLQTEVAAMNAAADAERKAAAEREAIMRRGESVTKSVMTTAEQYRAKMSDLRAMLQAGAISQETFNRAMRNMHAPAEQVQARMVGIQSANSQMTGGIKNSTFAVQQLAFGVQDAATVFGTTGLAGAIRASSNNVIQFASLINPLHGTIAALALTGVSLLSDWWSKSAAEAEKANAAHEKAHSVIKRLTQAIEEQGRAMRIRSEIMDATKSDQLHGMGKGKRAELAEVGGEKAAIERAIAEQQKIAADAKSRLGDGSMFEWKSDRKQYDDAKKNIAELSEMLDKANNKQRILSREVADIAAREGKLKAGEEVERRAKSEEQAGKERMKALTEHAAEQERLAKQVAEQEKKHAEDVARLKRSLVSEDDSMAGKVKQEEEKLKERIAEIKRLFAPGDEQSSLIDRAVQNADQRLKGLAGGSKAQVRNANMFAGTAEYGSAAAYSRVVQSNAPKEKTETDKNTQRLVDQGREQIRELGKISKAVEENVFGVVSL